MKRLLKNMSIYGLGGVLTKAIQFFLLPVYTRVLAPADYGSLELVYMVAAIIAMVYGLMISSGYLRNYYDSKEDDHRRVLLGSAVWFTFFSSLVLGGISITYSDSIADAVFDFEGGGLFIALITVSTALKAHSMIFYNLLMVREQAKRYVVLHLITLVVSLSLTVFLVVGKEWGVRGILTAQVSAFSLELLMLAVLMVRPSIFRFSWKNTREMLTYSVPLIPLQVASFVLALSNRYFLQEYRSLEEVGLFSLGYRFASILPLFAIEPLKAFGPHIFSMVDEPEKCKQTLANFTRYFCAGSCLVALGIGMFSREVIQIMSDSAYHSAHRIVFVLCLSYVFYGLNSLTGFAINIVKRNWLIAVS